MGTKPSFSEAAGVAFNSDVLPYRRGPSSRLLRVSTRTVSQERKLLSAVGEQFWRFDRLLIDERTAHGART
jgi:hypothetical protein